MITGINHITLSVSDLKRSLYFYEQILGLEVLEIWERGAYLAAGEFWLALNLDSQNEPLSSKGDSHLAFSVSKDDFGKMVLKLKQHAVVAYRKNSSPGQSYYFLDPDGHKLEIHEGSLTERRMALNAEKCWISKPDEALKAGLTAYYSEYKEAAESLYLDLYSGIEKDFSAYINRLKSQALGFQLPENWSKTTVLFLMKGSEVLGTVRFRHALLNAFAQKYIGHIGYDLKPSARGKGYGNLLLKAGLEAARKQGLDEVLLLCHESNEASKALIEKWGGRFESEILDEDGQILLRYWIKCL